MTIADADSPEAFIALLRREADKCSEASTHLQGRWSARKTKLFWAHACNALDRVADQLEKLVL